MAVVKGRVRILVATDLASRGLDVHDITHVFNYDFPRNVEEYVHRIGENRPSRVSEAAKGVTEMTDTIKSVNMQPFMLFM